MRKYVFMMCLILAGTCTTALWAQKKVSGTVTDGIEPLIGANVMVKGTTNGTITDANGKFVLDGVNNGVILQISFLGYTTQELTYKGETSLNIVLKEDALALGEVVVTAMGITKDQKKLGYAVSTIAASDLVKSGSPNFGTALYGKASGVKIASPPGGAAAGVSFNIRGISSINGDTQPLVILNGVPIRSGNDEGSSSTGQFASWGSNGKIRSNGLVDINPEDIESISILKGAAASALYGSEGANGVIVITSKKSKSSGITVDVNATLQANTLAYLPQVQTEYGPGHWLASRGEYELANNGFVTIDYKGKTYKTTKASQGVNHVWGPKYDGTMVLYWDGLERPYLANNTNPWMELFRTGYDQIYNVAINQGGENSSNRFSYTFMDEIPNGLTGDFKKHNYNLIGNLKLSKTLSLQYSGTLIVQKIHNRQGRATGAYDSFSNTFSSFADISAMKRMYKTSLGYRNVVTGEATLTPDESFAYSPGPEDWIKNYLWGQYMNNDYESESRFIGSVAPKWNITPWLTATARLSGDLTSNRIEVMNATTRPLSLYSGQGEGGYSISTKQYDILYGDALLTFDKNITDKINISATAGWSARQEQMMGLSSNTNGGLTIENAFLLTASRTEISASRMKMELLKTAILGTVDFSYGDFLFLGVTGRQEKSSTLPKGSNSYFYPSANLSFLYTEAFKDALPTWYDYGKLRFSYGIVGNAPAAYAANIVYTPNQSGSFQWTTIPSPLGNEKLRPEKITEWEIGWENKFFHNRAGFEISYYNKTISDMIIQQPLATSDGVGAIWMNIGEMVNSGVEISLNATPIENRDFVWDLRANLAFQANKVNKLVAGQDYLRGDGNMGNHGGGLNIRSYIGRPMGDLYANVIEVVEDESSPYYGQRIVDFDDDVFAIYRTSAGEAAQKRIGNIMPKAIGGLGTTISYKNFTLDAMTDFRIGGDVLDMSKQYPTARGLSKLSMQYRDAEHGGLPFEYKGKTYNSGMIIEGVVETINPDGSKTYTPNTTVTASDYYYNVTYNWGNSGGGTTYMFSVYENTYWKMRELSLSYTLPNSLISKARMKNLTLSIFGRNLFYLYKSLDDIDAESHNGGSTWGGQAGVGYTASPNRNVGVSLRASF
ncbi:MAG: SusC/RagA family TonB-linked outer membrane protein [Tannerella sp.]|jgi:TonB-linked SusC/RagA family outer membrane protein|nr:SusC/RagA family TonB-linked outer membrane protein [Tannerella sp.]